MTREEVPVSVLCPEELGWAFHGYLCFPVLFSLWPGYLSLSAGREARIFWGSQSTWIIVSMKNGRTVERLPGKQPWSHLRSKISLWVISLLWSSGMIALGSLSVRRDSMCCTQVLLRSSNCFVTLSHCHTVTMLCFVITCKEEKQLFKRERSYYLLLQNNPDIQVSVGFISFLLHQGIVNVHCGSLKITCM